MVITSTVMLRALVIAAFVSMPSVAQQTIFNVPSADVLERGKVYVELDAAFKPVSQSAQAKFSSFVPRFVIGIGKRVEVGLNLTGNIQPGRDTTTVVTAIKWRAYEDHSKSFALFAGSNLYFPIRSAAYRFGTNSYLAGSKTISKTRVTVGGFWASKHVLAPNAARGGAMVGIESTLSKRYTIAADWMSGSHANGYFTPGLIFKPKPRIAAYLGYSIGNDNAAKGNHYFLFEIGYSVN
jgi:hypothetical protein